MCRRTIPCGAGSITSTAANSVWPSTYFRAVVEKSPDNVTAWIGLAGSYDNIRRFDLADRAYREAIRLAGETPQILNNQGYSYMLRGDLRAARARFLKALRRDPHNRNHQGQSSHRERQTPWAEALTTGL